MSIWGKILGGVGGFAVGGPLGALIGAVAGHAVDKLRADDGGGLGVGSGGEAQRKIAFTIGVIVLSAKMAKADGHVTRDEIDAFKRVFQIPPSEMKNVGRLFDQARRDASGYEPYARQLSRMFRDNPLVLEELLGGLFYIARADGQVTDDEVEFLSDLAQIFGFTPDQWDRIRARNLPDDASDPFRILGVTRDQTDAEIKAAHRKLVLENHPDKLIAQGVPEEFIEVANHKLAAINAAYDDIRKLRGFS
ncbi:MAG: TerB family tellurite resistance protein [Pseudomonadota bacterium]